MNDHFKDFSWVGSQENFVDQVNIQHIEHIIVG